MKRGFTVIELIFVIVILGIIVATAIPKLSAVNAEKKSNGEIYEKSNY